MIPASFPRDWPVPVKTRNKTQNTQVPLVRWLSASYLRTAVIPLCLIELGFLLSYWATGNFTYQRNIQTVNRVSEQYLVDIAAREAANIDATLSGIEGLARILSLETKEALATPWTPDAAEKSRYHIGPDGVFHTIRGGLDLTIPPASTAVTSLSGARRSRKRGRLASLITPCVTSRRHRPWCGRCT
jgi:hypothetical protein